MFGGTGMLQVEEVLLYYRYTPFVFFWDRNEHFKLGLCVVFVRALKTAGLCKAPPPVLCVQSPPQQNSDCGIHVWLNIVHLILGKFELPDDLSKCVLVCENLVCECVRKCYLFVH
jgi:hypothetical protein